jgi:predicted negative regulator of RcsB-dependent stress response
LERAHRHQLKQDKFVERVGQTVDYATEHRQTLLKWGAIGLAVLVVALGWLFYNRSQAEARQAELREAVRLQQANVGPDQQANPHVASFATEGEKRTAVQKAWTDLVNKHPGSLEAMVAHYYMGVNAADAGNLQETEKQMKMVVDSGKEPYASQAKLSLAQVYASTDRRAEAEKLLRSVISAPTVLVSKEQATIALARVLAKDKPEEARKLLEPLRGERGPVSRAALSVLGELQQR